MASQNSISKTRRLVHRLAAHKLTSLFFKNQEGDTEEFSEDRSWFIPGTWLLPAVSRIKCYNHTNYLNFVMDHKAVATAFCMLACLELSKRYFGKKEEILKNGKHIILF